MSAPSAAKTHQHSAQAVEWGMWKKLQASSPTFLDPLIPSLQLFSSQMFLLAEKVASAGFYVVVPDFLYGDPYVPENAEKPISVWLKEHGTDKAFEDAKAVIEALKSKGVSSIGAAGFCWGAKVVVELAKHAYIQAAVMLHPSFVTLDDIQGVKVPISVLGAEIDQISPPELVKQFEGILNAKPEVDGFVKIFPGVAHGWTMRYKDEDEEELKHAEEAHQDMLDWFGIFRKTIICNNLMCCYSTSHVIVRDGCVGLNMKVFLNTRII
ncbi:uncharacterized protein LOC132295928 isoform X2 [Cornus florida]|uniref:uncharacterized protein LOC132295928 isoform X2 n=1 Tax=Cornus florida TaxID=4283 RepID=UPI0028986918|nr:uncharacterized protein LOC132295928 isoform X2 [Cornus florida]XP_059650184.1 uncharacterized protein LOC132295928 isoform X2 [Cornus florida]